MNRVAVSVLLLALLGVASCGEDVVVVSKIDNTSRMPDVPSWAKVAPEQIAEAKKHGVPVAFENDLGMRFVLIPAGTFLMGSPEDEEGRDDGETQHEVTITKPYYMQITEVTNWQYRGWSSSYDSGSYEQHALNGDDQPVVGARWKDAKEFGAWLSRQEELKCSFVAGIQAQSECEVGTSRIYELPSEAQWEHACRAGTRTRFSFGDRARDLVRHANFSDRNDPTGSEREDLDDGFAVTAAVGRYTPNSWGLYDMHGNVWEWCEDRYGPYPAGRVTDPVGAATGEEHVYRGGSWRWFPWFARSAMRRRYPPEPQMKEYGFRLVSPLPERSK